MKTIQNTASIEILHSTDLKEPLRFLNKVPSVIFFIYQFENNPPNLVGIKYPPNIKNVICNSFLYIYENTLMLNCL